MTTKNLIYELKRAMKESPISAILSETVNRLEEQSMELEHLRSHNQALISANSALSCELSDLCKKLKSFAKSDLNLFLDEGIVVEAREKFVFTFPYVENNKVEWESKEAVLQSMLSEHTWLKTYTYNPKSWEYMKDMYQASCRTKRKFPALYDAIFGSNGTPDFVFSKGSDEHYVYYFNPDSNAGGQIVACPFDDAMARRMLEGEDWIDVVAEVPQYLADINEGSFFDVIADLINNFEEGQFVGIDVTEENLKKILEGGKKYEG